MIFHEQGRREGEEGKEEMGRREGGEMEEQQEGSIREETVHSVQLIDVFK